LVLLVDRHQDTRDLYATSLRALGFDTTAVDDGTDAYTQAWQTHPDIIVTEISLSFVDAWEFIRDVMGDPRTRDIPVVIVTSQTQAAARDRARREGCAAFLVKPCLPEQLATELRAVLYQTAAQDHTSPAQ
jgi:CheY-like chemotaxis protein